MDRFIAFLTGGRPMRRGKYRFVDLIHFEPVYEFTDYYGRQWMARHKWSLFRVALRRGI